MSPHLSAAVDGFTQAFRDFWRVASYPFTSVKPHLRRILWRIQDHGLRYAVPVVLTNVALVLFFGALFVTCTAGGGK